MNQKIMPQVVVVARGRDAAPISISSILDLRITLPHNPHPYICPSFCLCSVPFIALRWKGKYFFLSFTICKVFEPLFIRSSGEAWLLHKVLTPVPRLRPPVSQKPRALERGWFRNSACAHSVPTSTHTWVL